MLSGVGGGREAFGGREGGGGGVVEVEEEGVEEGGIKGVACLFVVKECEGMSELLEEGVSGDVVIAPMLDVTNTWVVVMGVRGRFERFMLRQLSYKCILYSEMFVAETLMYSRYTDDIIEFFSMLPFSV